MSLFYIYNIGIYWKAVYGNFGYRYCRESDAVFLWIPKAGYLCVFISSVSAADLDFVLSVFGVADEYLFCAVSSPGKSMVRCLTRLVAGTISVIGLYYAVGVGTLAVWSRNAAKG